jgi:hypothetical protein
LESVAAAVREKGYTCAQPMGMDRSKAGAAEDVTEWLIRCESGTYRVSFHRDLGAGVEPVK